MDIRYAYRYMRTGNLTKYHVSTFIPAMQAYAKKHHTDGRPLLLFVLDFEATCIHDPTDTHITDDQKAAWKAWEDTAIARTEFSLPPMRRDWPNEIIEWPTIVLVVLTSGIVIRGPIFRTYVQPTEHPILHPFCTYLTGITQADLASAPTIDQVLVHFEQWQRRVFDTYQMSEQYGFEHSIMVTCGDWDCNRCLRHEVERKKLHIPISCQYWCNLKVAMEQFGYPNIKGTKDMLDAVQLQFEGKQHSGIVDTHNYCRIIEQMGELHRKKKGGAPSFMDYFLPTTCTHELIVHVNQCMQQHHQDSIRMRRDASELSAEALQRWIERDFSNFGPWFIRNDMVVAAKSKDLTQSEQNNIQQLIQEWALDHTVYYHSLPDFHRISTSL